MSFSKVLIFSFAFLIILNFVKSLKDFEKCNVGKNSITTNLQNLEFNCPKHNEIFRIKWFMRNYYPYFVVKEGQKHIEMSI